MIGDILTVARKELKEIPQQAGGSRGGGPWGMVAMVAMIGVFLPWQMGEKFLRPQMLAILGMMPISMVLAVVADSFAGERERHTLETLLASPLSDSAILFGKLAAIVGSGWTYCLFCVAVALTTVNIKAGHGRLLLPDPATGLAVVLLSLLFVILMACAGVLVSLRSSTVRQAQQTMGIAFMLLIFGGIFGFQALPREWRSWLARQAMTAGATRLVLVAAGILLAISLVLLAAAMARFKRARLVLD